MEQREIPVLTVRLAPDFAPLIRATLALKFDHRAARQRDVAGDAHGTALGELECRVLLVIDVLARRAIDRNDDLVAALHRFLGRADGGALERVAAYDHGLDAGLFEHRLERRAEEFVRPALAVPFAGARFYRRI